MGAPTEPIVVRGDGCRAPLCATSAECWTRGCYIVHRVDPPTPQPAEREAGAA